ncbi:unnamed protein product [Mycena citricolor]|uniref:J domain-containing protein n=1 Tax=Mycena citricolor TaxID=2018698 RepID=A0AAD2K7Q7_9AGAR|nr:unnamed protein product [Mycena citricolor]
MSQLLCRRRHIYQGVFRRDLETAPLSRQPLPSRGLGLYKILDVHNSASEEGSAAHAYKKLSRKYHPDKNKDPGAEDRLWRLLTRTKSCRTLRNETYMTGMERWLRAAFFGCGIDPIAGGAEGTRGGSQQGNPFDMFSKFFGGGFQQQQQARRGPTSVTEFEVELSDIYKGANNDNKGGWRRKESSLYWKETIGVEEALLGFERNLTHLDGHIVTLSRKGVTQPGFVQTIEEEGMPHFESNTHGELYVEYNVVLPRELSTPDTPNWTAPVFSKPLTMREITYPTRACDFHLVRQLPQHLGTERLRQFYGPNNFDGRKNKNDQKIVIQEKQTQCEVVRVEIIQQKLAIIQELDNHRQICDVETQTIVLEQHNGVLKVLGPTIQRTVVKKQIGYDKSIAAKLSQIVELRWDAEL